MSHLLAPPQRGINAMGRDARGELVEFIFHNAFYPVLMANRDGYSDDEKTQLKRVQNVIYAEIERFRSYQSAEEVIANFERDLSLKPAKQSYAELKALNLPVINDLREEFERKAHELGVRT
jgi:hypothetical protein